MVCNFPLSSQQVLYGYITNLASHKQLVTFMALLWSKWLSHKILHCNFFFNCFYCEIPLWRILGNMSHSYGIDLLNLVIGLHLSIVYEQSEKLIKNRTRAYTEGMLDIIFMFWSTRIILNHFWIHLINWAHGNDTKTLQFGLFTNSFLNIITLKLSEI